MNKPVVVLFERFGPYHNIRLAATSDRINVAAVEITARDNTYAWEIDESRTTFEKVTLFSDLRGVSSAKSLVNAVWSSLDRLQPMVVAIPGWSELYAHAALRWCVQRRVPAVMMSDSTAEDAPRRWWRERIKSRLVRLCDAALVGGRSHHEYIKRLGISKECIFI